MDTDRFCAVLTVRDDHHRGLAPVIAQRLAAEAGAPLTVFDATRDAARSDEWRSARTVVLDPHEVGARVKADVAGRDGALLVVDAHGGGSGGQGLLDADVEHVLTGAHLPVLVVGPRASVPDGDWVLVVPVDGTGAEQAPCRVAARWLHTFATAGVLVVALDVADTWPDDGTEPSSDPAGAAIATLAQEGARATAIHRATGDAAATIIDVALATPASVIVAVGSAAERPSHWPATVRRLVREAPCPVLVVPDDRS